MLSHLTYCKLDIASRIFEIASDVPERNGCTVGVPSIGKFSSYIFRIRRQRDKSLVNFRTTYILCDIVKITLYIYL